MDADQRPPRLTRREAAADRAAPGAHRAHERDGGGLRPRGSRLGHDRAQVLQGVVGLGQHAIQGDQPLRHARCPQRGPRAPARVAQPGEVPLERGAHLELQLRALLEHGVGGQRGARGGELVHGGDEPNHRELDRGPEEHGVHEVRRAGGKADAAAGLGPRDEQRGEDTCREHADRPPWAQHDQRRRRQDGEHERP